MLSPLLSLFLSLPKSLRKRREVCVDPVSSLSSCLASMQCIHRTSWEQEFKRSVLLPLCSPMGLVTNLSLSKEQTHRIVQKGREPGEEAKEKGPRQEEEQGERKMRRKEAPTSLRDIGVLSSSGRCCSRAKTMQLAMMVAKIMYSNGVGKEELRNRFTEERGTQPPRWLCTSIHKLYQPTLCAVCVTDTSKQAGRTVDGP